MTTLMFSFLYFFCVGVAIGSIEYFGLEDYFQYHAISLTYPLVILVSLYLNLNDPEYIIIDAQDVPWDELRGTSLEHPKHAA
jgi:hypothetical protein